MQNNKTVESVTNGIISKFEDDIKAEKPDTAVLAALRNSIGRPISEAAGVWPVLFESMPESFLSVNGKPTYQENAVFVALQLYALAKQGSANNIVVDSDYKGNMGRSLLVGFVGRPEEKRDKKKDDDKKREAIDRRFNIMVSAENFEGFTYHLRQLFKLLKSKAKSPMEVNFGKLADDLYRYQLGEKGKNKICFQWSEGYYGRNKYTESQKEEDIIND